MSFASISSSASNRVKWWRSWMVRRPLVATLIALLILATFAAVVLALDLRTAGSFGWINGAYFQAYDPADPTGSGNFNSFVRIGGGPVIEGYNSSHRPVEFDENTSPQFTKDVLLSEVPIVSKDGVLYREFQLDINQNAGVPNGYLSVDELQLFTTTTAGITGYPFTGQATLVYDMDGAGDDVVQLNYNLNNGSGKRDLRVLIPNSLFGNDLACTYGGTGCATYVVLYTQLGGLWENNDGYEEWGVAIYPVASKAGMKFEDLNANGAKDANEPGLAGWTIYVDINNDGQYQVGEPFAVTDATGAYKINAIIPGDWYIREVMQANWACSYPDADPATAGVQCYYHETFAPGDVKTGNDFGNFRLASKSGYKFHDLNANGVWDKPAELGLAGWEICIGTNCKTTDANGYYEFTGLTPGVQYTVCEKQKTDWFQSFPTTNNGCWVVTLTSGQADTDNNFGNYQNATKSGMKFHDLNANGVKDAGDVGLAGWTIQAWQGTTKVGETTTAADGTYSFSLKPGSYKVCEVLKANWVQSFPATTDGCYNITLVSQQRDVDNDFGNYQNATKSGMKFHDLNANGVKDAGDVGLAGWTIQAWQGTTKVGETTTAADGTYSFSLKPGSYKVCEVLKTGWFQSFPKTADGCYDITLVSQQVDADNDFGNYQKATKSGYKWNDLDKDGVWDTGEPALTAWSICIGTNCKTTDANGKYEFTGLMPGVEYTVCETVVSGYFQSFPKGTTTPPAGETIVACGTNWGYKFKPTSGQSLTGNNFGNWKPLGCTLTQGYWKTHDLDGPAGPYDLTWDLKGGGSALFFNTGYTWSEIMDMPPAKGNAYLILAHQYAAAWLNANNVDPMKKADTWMLGTALADAEKLLTDYALDYDFKANPTVRDQFITLAGILGSFNEGMYGPPHCD